MSKILIIGASSTLGGALADQLAEKGHELLLTGRSGQEIGLVATDLEIRHGIDANAREFDISQFEHHLEFANWCYETGSSDLYGVIVCPGYMGRDPVDLSDTEDIRRVFDINLTAQASIASVLAQHLKNSGRGFVCLISSVAGDRGRQSNFIYGAAKGGLAVFAQGLRNYLHDSGVKIITIKPGMFESPMAIGKGPSFLISSPEQVSKKIVKAIIKNKDIKYVPGYWRIIMAVIRSIPESIFKKLKL